MGEKTVAQLEYELIPVRLEMISDLDRRGSVPLSFHDFRGGFAMPRAWLDWWMH
ncbi:hypothetical protein R1flu_007745 [Riccia fluitans]|uniref:Uncharacterized protein n=1 Tax=Riccia fluitans TaxID=41844 RepID=A0ABD1YZT7_9MARC